MELLIGRKEEQRVKKKALQSHGVEMIAVIGRRRGRDTQQDVQMTWVFLSTFGLVQNQHSLELVTNDLTLEDLFRK